MKRFNSLLKDFFNLKQKSLFAIHNPAGVKLLSRLRLKLSHLNEHKYRHNFKDVLTPLCDYGSETETIIIIIIIVIIIIIIIIIITIIIIQLL